MTATDYATLEQLKEWLEISDQASETLLTQALKSASRSIDNITGRTFGKGSAARARRYWPQRSALRTNYGDVLLVDDIADATDVTVESGSTASGWSPVTGYETAPDSALEQGAPITSLVRTQGCWPVQLGTQIRVTAVWGWPEIPAEVAQACLIQAGRLYRRKDSPEGVMGSSEWGPIRVSRVDPDVQALVLHLTLPGIG